MRPKNNPIELKSFKLRDHINDPYMNKQIK